MRRYFESLRPADCSVLDGLFLVGYNGRTGAGDSECVQRRRCDASIEGSEPTELSGRSSSNLAYNLHAEPAARKEKCIAEF
jgi:hypothetical protein